LAAVVASAMCVPAQTAPAAAPAPQQQPTPQPTPQTPATQQPASQTPVNDEAATQTIKVGVNEVDLVFTVTDKKGHFIKGLKLSDFGLLDNHMQPQQVLRFQQQTDLPLR